MAVVLLIVGLPVPGFAAEGKATAYTRDEVVALASEVFSEHADKILEAYAEESSAPSARGAKYLVRELFEETPTGERLSYAEYSDGEILLSVAEANPYHYSDSTTDLTIDGNVSYYTINVVGTSSEVSGEFTWSNICITIYGNGNDRFTSLGTGVATGRAFLHQNASAPTVVRMIENSSGKAIAKYLIGWRYGNGATDYYESILMVEVGGNNFRIKHDHWYNLV